MWRHEDGERVIQTSPARPGWFDAALEAQIDALYRAARYLARSESDAEDLAQDTVVRALDRHHQFRQGTNMKAWLLTILTRLYYDRFRGQQRKPQNVSLEECDEFDLYQQVCRDGGSGPSEDPAVLAEQRLAAADVQDAVCALPEEYRGAIVLALVNEMNYAEVAAALEIPIGTVRSRISRGRALLQRRLWQYAREA